MSIQSKETNEFNPRAFRFWPTWAAIGLMGLMGQLPFRARLMWGRWLGRLMYMFARRRRHVAEINLRMCFPDMPAKERESLMRRMFEENAIGVFETAYAYFGDMDEVLKRTRYEGLEALQAAMARGQGVLLLGAHYAVLDLGGILLSPHCDVVTMYRANDNPVLNAFIKARRARFTKANYERSQLRPVLRHLKQGDVVWYAPDQDYGRKVSVFAPFFGITAATITTTAKLAGFNDSAVFFLGYHRNRDDRGYTVRLVPLDERYPTGDDVQDATIVNAGLETMIMIDPAQYMWVHRRFKTRPDGEKRPYKPRVIANRNASR
jgi:KDO2-lipid IV(A) lauroyltransferase